MKHKPMLKEVLRPGVFVDWSGKPTIVDDEDPGKYAAGTEALRAAGHPVRGYPSHGTDDAMTILCDWSDFQVRDKGDGPRVVALCHPADDLTPEQVEKIKGLQVSCVIHQNYNNGELQLERCITRVDIVGAGAVLGLAPFEEAAAAALSSPRDGRGLSTGPALSAFEDIPQAAPAAEESVMKDKLGAKLASLKALMEYEGDDESFVKEMGAALAEFPSKEWVDEENAEHAEKAEEKAESEMGEPMEGAMDKAACSAPAALSSPPPSKAELELQARVRELEGIEFQRTLQAKTAGLSAPLPANSLQRLQQQYAALSPEIGHKKAMATLIPQLDDLVSLTGSSANLSSAQEVGRKLSAGAQPQVHQPAVDAVTRLFGNN